MAIPYPKRKTKKKRMHHPKSIIHSKEDHTCYICMMRGDYSMKQVLHEHHIFHGTADRKWSEEYGMKVYLCPGDHLDGEKAVHKCKETNLMLKRKGQQEFEKIYGHEKFMEVFKRNYL